MDTRGLRLALLFVGSLLVVLATSSISASESGPDHPVVGRFNLVSEAGGAVWTFQGGGDLIVLGPGELMARGSWAGGPAAREFDATLDVGVTGQQLDILGTVSPDEMAVAIVVYATEPTDPSAGLSWPTESRLIGERLGMVAEGTPAPSASVECARPAWTPDEQVDWDRCDEVVTPA